MSNRQETNQELVDILQYLIETQPELRFGQILSVYNFVSNDPFYDESTSTLDKVKIALEKYHGIG